MGPRFVNNKNLSARKVITIIKERNFDLYRDDGLALVSSSSGLVLDSLRKDIISIFKNEALSITVEKNFNDRDKY